MTKYIKNDIQQFIFIFFQRTESVLSATDLFGKSLRSKYDISSHAIAYNLHVTVKSFSFDYLIFGEDIFP